jgi:hypothetical protein
MKLELKHLAPYLPYGLKILRISRGAFRHSEDVSEIIKWSKNDIDILFGKRHHIRSVKPILRPLSDLTKEIKINDKVTLLFAKDYFLVSAKEEEGFILNGIIPGYWEVNINMLKSGDYGHLDYWVIEKLFEWHFDVLGLIEKGLAIDINTI